MVKISAAMAIKLLNKRPHKYGAQKTKCLHGHEHDSKKEAMWCLKLHQMQKDGKIFHLQLQQRFTLCVDNGERRVAVCEHIPDFTYHKSLLNMPLTIPIEKQFPDVVVEVKGMPTPEWKLKKKLFEALYPDIEYQVV